jgi:hypothetical protein
LFGATCRFDGRSFRAAFRNKAIDARDTLLTIVVFALALAPTLKRMPLTLHLFALAPQLIVRPPLPPLWVP